MQVIGDRAVPAATTSIFGCRSVVGATVSFSITSGGGAMVLLAAGGSNVTLVTPSGTSNGTVYGVLTRRVPLNRYV